MIFCELVQLLSRYKKSRMGQAVFLKTISDAFYSEYEDDSGILQKNPMYDYKDRMLQYIFKGEKPIAEDVAQVLAGGFDRASFEAYFEEFSYDALENMASDLSAYGFEAHADTVPMICASIMDQIIHHIAAGEPEAVYEVDYIARETGKRIKDVPITTVEMRGDKLHINGEVITVDVERINTEDVDENPKYLTAIYEAFESALNRKVDASVIDTLPRRFRETYKESNEGFYLADAIEHRLRETFDDGEEEFMKLKKDEWHGISGTYWKNYENGFERMSAVMDESCRTNLNDSCLMQIRNLINTLARKGICHILVNDGTIPSWVNLDE